MALNNYYVHIVSLLSTLDSTYQMEKVIRESLPVAIYAESHVIVDERLTKMYVMSSIVVKKQNKTLRSNSYLYTLYIL